MTEKPITNEEIDALMEAVQAGQIATGNGGKPAKNVKPYDFARPDRLSREQLRTLEMIYAGSARGITTQLAGPLRTAADVELKSVAEVTCAELFEAGGSPTIIALVGIEPLEGRAVLEIDTSLAFSMIDRLLGGPGRAPITSRDLTEIEKGLMRGVIDRFMGCITESWSTLIALTPKLEMMIGSALFSQIALPEDRLIRARFEVRFGSASGTVGFGLPVGSLQPVLGKLNAQQWLSGGKQAGSEELARMIERNLDAADLEVAVVLGIAEVTIGDLLDLQVGDLIRLDQRAGSEIEALIDNDVKFRGQPGQIGRRYGLQITQVLNREE